MKDNVNIQDEVLLEKFLSSGNKGYLGDLLKRYTVLLYGVGLKYLKNEEAAKDMVQQIFEKVITIISTQKIVHFKGWLYTVARNECLMKLRQKPFYKVDESYLENNLAEEEGSIERIHDKERLLSITEACIETLSVEQKTCIKLFYLQKKSYNQIVIETGYTLPQVKSFIQNGKRNLKIMVEKSLKQLS